MLAPASLSIREDRNCAEWTLDRSSWLWPYALVSIKVFFEEDVLALGALGIFFSILALFKQMILQVLNLDDLLALPTCSEHGTILPVVDVESFCVKIFIEAAAEVTNLFIGYFSSVRIHLLLVLWLELLLIWGHLKVLLVLLFCFFLVVFLLLLLLLLFLD